jgi:hypothetical protein
MKMMEEQGIDLDDFDDDEDLSSYQICCCPAPDQHIAIMLIMHSQQVKPAFTCHGTRVCKSLR